MKEWGGVSNRIPRYLGGPVGLHLRGGKESEEEWDLQGTSTLQWNQGSIRAWGGGLSYQLNSKLETLKNTWTFFFFCG